MDNNKKTTKGLTDFSKKLISDFKGELIHGNKLASYGLVNSLEFKLFNMISSIRIDFLYADYGKFVESGSKPHWVPIAPLKSWATAKGKDEKFAYAVQNKISKDGVKAYPFVDFVLSQKNVESNLENILLEAYGEDLEIQLESLLDKNLKSYFKKEI